MIDRKSSSVFLLTTNDVKYFIGGCCGTVNINKT